MFSMVAPAYAAKYGVGDDQMSDVLATISAKNHYNGARNPRAQFRREVSKETICASPRVAGQLGVFDCAGVADGAAAAIVVRAEDAHRYTDKPLYIKALSFAAGSGSGLIDPELRLHPLPRVRGGGRRRLPPGRDHRPAAPAGLGRGARLLHPHRAGAHGGPRVRRAGHGLEGGADRHLRPGRRAPGQPRRRPEELRPPGRARPGCACSSSAGSSSEARPPPSARSAPTAPWPSPTTSAATRARWCRSSR